MMFFPITGDGTVVQYADILSRYSKKVKKKNIPEKKKTENWNGKKYRWFIRYFRCKIKKVIEDGVKKTYNSCSMQKSFNRKEG